MKHIATHVTQRTIKEILSQPSVWKATLDRLDASRERISRYLPNGLATELLLTGCGSSYYLPLTGAALYTECTRSSARGVAASEVAVWPQAVFAEGKDYCLVAFSRSGETP